ncbi:MAG: glycosyltransferase [Pedosphaera sp.]|nr:glycosyltransferase [Pedosphaera sp.]
MTTRRRPDFLIKTLRSIQRQSIADFEVIVSDNDTAGSGGPVVASLNDSRFRHYVNEQDLGMNASFNRSLAKAQGEFVVMITDDDPIYPDMLETLKDISGKHPGYGAYFGGCDVLQMNPVIAKLVLHKVGTNSCLAPLRLDTVRTYTREQFPHAFFNGELDMYTLWSVGMVKREIAQEVGGLPNYGSPYLGDFAYIVSVCSDEGCVIINRALGCQTVHDFNFGRKECDQLKTAAVGFNDYIEKRFGKRPDWPELKPKVEKFVGNWVILHSLFLRQYFKQLNITDHNLDAILKELFRIPYIRRLRLYYHLGKFFIFLQQKQAELRQFVLGRMKKAK